MPSNNQKWKSWIAVVKLATAYVGSGYMSLVTDYALHFLMSQGISFSEAMVRSLQVLFGHLSWVALGIMILNRDVNLFQEESNWMKLNMSTNWVWWSFAGYCISTLSFNIADVINQVHLIVYICLFIFKNQSIHYYYIFYWFDEICLYDKI